MPDSIESLFTRWRQGDREAGQAMAQRVSDWFFAIAVVRLGEEAARAAVERAGAAFAGGVAGLDRADELVAWAHGLVAREVAAIAGGDPPTARPNALTRGRSPLELVQRVAVRLDPAHARLLDLLYDPEQPTEAVVDAAEEAGGMPGALLEARLALKRLLAEHEGVALEVLPDEPLLDCGPLPLYEAGRISAPAELAHFEQWLVTDPVLCQDLAEFAVFAHALRRGALQGAPVAEEADVRAAEPDPAPRVVEVRADDDSPDERRNRLAFAAMIAGVVLLLGLIVYVLFFGLS